MAKLSAAIAVSVSLAAPVTALADTFDFETGLSFSRSEQTSVLRGIESLILPIPPAAIQSFTARANTESDRTAFSGTWFVSGVNINEGPRSRAGFLSRASSVTLEYADSSLSLRSRTIYDDPNRPDLTFAQSRGADSLMLGGRYVSEGSGWYGLGSFSSLDAGMLGDSESYRLGAGKYVGERTSVDLTVRYDDFSFGNETTFALALSHVGDLSAQWQYGADVTLSRPDASGAEVLMDAAFSLYPSRSVAFGLQYSGSLENLDGFARYEAFASWFINEQVEISARYGVTDFENTPLIDVDDDRWGLGVRVRF